MLDGLYESFEFETAEGKAVVGIWPVLLNLNGVHELSDGLLVMAQFFISASKIENTRFMLRIQDKSLVIAIQCVLIFSHLVEHHALVIPVI